MQRLKTILFIITLFSGEVFGQDTLLISSQMISEADVAKNLQVQGAQQEAEVARAKLSKSRAMYLPSVTASYGFINTNNPLMAFGAKLNQERIAMTDFDPAGLNNPKPINNFSTKIEVQQPIFNQDAIYQKKAGKVQAEVLAISSRRSEEQIRFELQKAYMMLQLAYKMQETLAETKKMVRANKRVIENYYKNGLVQKTDVLLVEVRESEVESQLQTARSNIENASDYLFFLLNQDSKDKILKPLEPLTYQPAIIPTSIALNLQRKDLLAMDKSVEEFDWMLKASKAQLLPRLNAFGSYELYDKDFARFRASGYLIGMQLSWSVFDGLKSQSERAVLRSQKNQTQIRLEQYTKQSQLELEKSARAVRDAESKVKWAEQALAQSREAYRIQKNRYDQGLIKAADLLTTETLMTQKDLELQQAVFEHNSAMAYYQFLQN